MSEIILALNPEHLRIVRAILASALPPEAEVWVFGSRAGGLVKRSSDLDLAIDAGRRLTDRELGTLQQEFEDSDLPFEVDVLDWQAISESFRAIIAKTRILLDR